MLRTATVAIKGTTALLMNRFPLEPVEAIGKKPKEEQAEIAAYRTPDGQLFVPGVNVLRSLVAAAVYTKGKGRGSLQKNAAACMMVTPEHLILPQQEYTIDSRAVVVPATKGRIVRHRPRFDEWCITFDLDFDDELISQVEAHKIVTDMGKRVGLGDFRPEKKGPFGRSMITKWDVAAFETAPA